MPSAGTRRSASRPALPSAEISKPKPVAFALMALQPAETLWELVDEPLVNKHIATIEALEDIVANRCRALADQPTIIKSRTGFHWWPKIAVPK